MSSTSELADFAARVRRFIRASTNGVECALVDDTLHAFGGRDQRANGSPSPPLEERAGERRPVTILDAAVRSGGPAGCRTKLSGVLAEDDGLLSLPLSAKGGKGNGAAASEHRGQCKIQPVDMLTFERLALELFALQFEHNAPYRRFCEARHARPDSVPHWTAIPAVPAAAFKEWDLSCLPVEERTTVFHSSGTTGQQPSRHFHDAKSMALYEASLLHWFKAHWQMAGVSGQATDDKCQIADGQWLMAILTPPPAEAPHSSLVHMFETIRRESGAGESRFVGKVAEDGAWALELERTVQLARKASSTGEPLLMLGTAFSFVHLLDYLAERGIRFALPPGSCAMETGGYKGRSRSLSKPALHALISQRLGISPHHIICEYGMSELSSQAYDWAIAPARTAHDAPRTTVHAPRRFHFPPWARVQIISPETGTEVGEGETGLIRVFDLANVYSVMAVQTEDLGVRYGDGFALAGRAAVAEPRGCSLMAV